MILLLHFVCCLFMTGLIFYVQIVHYPSFSFVSEKRFRDFHHFHVRRTSYVVMPVMLAELVTGALLLWFSPASSLLTLNCKRTKICTRSSDSFALTGFAAFFGQLDV